MIKMLFVCHGNICRSPMAECIMKSLVKGIGKENMFEISSAATSTEELGNSVYPPAARELKRHGFSNFVHTARQMNDCDYKYYDYIYVMDKNNMNNARIITCGDPNNKIYMLLQNQEIEDPWYTGNYSKVYSLIEHGCKEILDNLL